MKQKYDEIDTKECKEFFEWLLERNVEIIEEYDPLFAGKNYYPFICYTKEIAEFLNTTPMKRLNNILQLGTKVFEDENIYHTRLEHCKGTYKIATDFWIIKCRDENFRKLVEQKNFKLEILANIMYMLRHDDCHTMLSHALESLICDGKKDHEDIGKRILKENPEYKEKLDAIAPGLRDIMIKRYAENNVISLNQLTDGNLDFDKLDYIFRDLLYLGKEVDMNFLNLLANNTQIDIEDEKNPIIYFGYALDTIKHIITERNRLFLSEYASPNRSLMDNACKKLCKIIMDENIETKYIGKTISNYRQSNIEDIDLDEFLATDDIMFLVDAINIARNNSSEEIRNLASFCMPNIKGLMNISINSIYMRKKDEKSFREVDREFVNLIRQLKKEKDTLNKILQNSENINEKSKIVSFKSEEEFNKKSEEIKRFCGIDNDEKNIPGIIFMKRHIKMYSENKPVYFESVSGDISELTRYMNCDKQNLYNILIYPDEMRLKGYSQNKVNEILTMLETNRDESLIPIEELER